MQPKCVPEIQSKGRIFCASFAACTETYRCKRNSSVTRFRNFWKCKAQRPELRFLERLKIPTLLKTHGSARIALPLPFRVRLHLRISGNAGKPTKKKGGLQCRLRLDLCVFYHVLRIFYAGQQHFLARRTFLKLAAVHAFSAWLARIGKYADVNAS